MIDHLAVDVSDLIKSGHFYDNALEPLGYKKLMEAPQEFGGRLILAGGSCCRASYQCFNLLNKLKINRQNYRFSAQFRYQSS